MKVITIKCPKCKDSVFSRAHHDFRSCSCGAVSIDGGTSYTRCLWDPDLFQTSPDLQEIEIKQTKQELYDDWNHRTDKYGIIKETE